MLITTVGSYKNSSFPTNLVKKDIFRVSFAYFIVFDWTCSSKLPWRGCSPGLVPYKLPCNMLQREPSTIVVAGQLFFTVAKLKKEKKLRDYLLKSKLLSWHLKILSAKNNRLKYWRKVLLTSCMYIYIPFSKRSKIEEKIAIQITEIDVKL